MSDPVLFEDTFTINSINAQKYDRVSRLECENRDKSITFTLDVNTELYPCAVGESVSMAIASTLSLDGKEDNRTSWREVSNGEPSLADDYDYVCHGKVYRFAEGQEKDTMSVLPRVISKLRESHADKCCSGPFLPHSVACYSTWSDRTTRPAPCASTTFIYF